jgi:hypothetical protein
MSGERRSTSILFRRRRIQPGRVSLMSDRPKPQRYYRPTFLSCVGRFETFPLRLVLCNGRTVFDQVVKLVDARLVQTGRASRIGWWIGEANIGGRTVFVGGWNIPLARPTGLGSTGEAELGTTLLMAARSFGLKS